MELVPAGAIYEDWVYYPEHGDPEWQVRRWVEGREHRSSIVAACVTKEAQEAALRLLRGRA